MASITATSTAKPPNIPPSIDPISDPKFKALSESLGRKSATMRVAWAASGLGIGIVEASEAARRNYTSRI